MSINSPLNAMTVDVEDYFHVAALARSIDREDWPRIPLRVEQNTLRLLEIFAEAGVTATFFVLGWVAERLPSLIRRIDQAGHEVACHGYSHRMVYDQTPQDFLNETRRAKRLLEDVIGSRVRGYRAASYSITHRSLWALDILAEMGFEYDSSIFPVRHNYYGIPTAPRFLHEVYAPGGAKLIEFPPSTFRVAGINLPAPGGGYFRLYPYAVTRRILRALNQREGQPAIFYLHPWEIDVDQPRVKAPLLSRFRHYNNLAKCETRLRRLLEDFRFVPVREVLAQQGFARATA